MKKLLLAFIVMLSTSIFSSALLAAPQLGREFDAVAQTIPTEKNGKIEVMEIFWYGCSHCYQMETPLHDWLANKPADVDFKRVPGLPNPSWAPMAQAYYTMEALNITEKLHSKLFDAIHKHKKLNPTKQKDTIDWLANNSGLDRKKVEDTFNSFAINAKLKRAAQLFRSSGATGVPSLVVDGKYITSGTMANGNGNAIKVVEYILKNIRASKNKTPAKK